MIKCNKCKDVRLIKNVMGDGKCDKHGRFAFYNRNVKELCPLCAKDKNICQICGKSLD